MRHDTRLSRVLHILIHMEKHEGAATSENIAAMLQTNPVVVRRTMAGLREHGYVSSEKGHGGGWVLAQPLTEITLLDIYRALGAPELFSIGLAGDNPNCVIEQAVNAALFDAMNEAENILLSRFGSITLSTLAEESIDRWSKLSNCPPPWSSFKGGWLSTKKNRLLKSRRFYHINQPVKAGSACHPYSGLPVPCCSRAALPGWSEPSAPVPDPLPQAAWWRTSLPDRWSGRSFATRRKRRPERQR